MNAAPNVPQGIRGDCARYLARLRKHRSRLLPLLPLWLGFLSAGVGGCSPRADTLVRAQHGEPFVVGYANEPPFAYPTTVGEPDGESPALAREITRRLGISHVHWQLLEFAELIPALQSGRIDVIASGLFITPQRARLIAFSAPTFRVHAGVLGRSDDPAFAPSANEPMGLADVTQLRVAAITGSVEAQRLQDGTISAPEWVSVPDLATAEAMLKHGDIGAITLSAPTLRELARRNPEFRFRLLQLPPAVNIASTGAFAFRREDRHLLEAWNRELGNFVGTPAHLSLIEKFGFNSNNLP